MKIAIIPARGGSKGVPQKNLQTIGGKSLLSRAIAAAQDADLDAVIVSTDDRVIAAEASALGAQVHNRSNLTASDSASSESVVLEVIADFGQSWPTDTFIALVQPTTPFIKGEAIRECLEIAMNGGVGFTATKTHEFLWHQVESEWMPVNHPKLSRARRQDRPITVSETGGCYAFPMKDFKASGYRYCATPKPVLVPLVESFQIDSFEDLAIANQIALLTEAMSPGKDLFIYNPPKLLVMDFDGCLTDDRVYVDQYGNEMVAANRKDGLAVHNLKKRGILLLILSSEGNPVVGIRAKKMQVEVIQGANNKFEVLNEFLRIQEIDWSQVWYLGNDLNDLRPMQNAAVSICPNDATEEIRAISTIVLSRSGGWGVLSEIESILGGNS